MAKFSKRSLDALKGVHPDLVRVMHEAIKATPVDFTITDGVRTQAQQAALYRKGRTDKSSGIVTQADGVVKKSNHQIKADGYGHAVDLYPFVNGGLDFNDKGGHLRVIAAHIKATATCLGVRVEWGGDWKGAWDKPHFELKR